MVITRTLGMRKQVENLLCTLNSRENIYVNDCDQAKLVCRFASTLSFIIVEAVEPLNDHLTIARMIRWDRVYHDPALPIISIGNHWTSQNIKLSLDAGISEFLSFPCSYLSFLRHIVHSIYNAPPFVNNDGYQGPDRRKTISKKYQGALRRKTDSSVPPPPLPDEDNVQFAISQEKLRRLLEARKNK